MPNQEVSVFTNRSNTFKGSTEALEFARNFFAQHGVNFSGKVEDKDYSIKGRLAEPHGESVDKAKFLIAVFQDPTMFEYYKLLIKVSELLKSMTPEFDSELRFHDSAKFKSMSELEVGLWSYVEKKIRTGEGMGTDIYNGIAGRTKDFYNYYKALKTLFTSSYAPLKYLSSEDLAIKPPFDLGPDREEIGFYSYGQIYSRETYKGGHKVSEIVFHKNGQKKSYTSYADGKIHQAFIYNEDGKLIGIEDYYPSGNKKYRIAFHEESTDRPIKIITYNDLPLLNNIQSTNTVSGDDLFVVLEHLNSVPKAEDIISSTQKPTAIESAAVLAFAKELVRNSTDINKLETVVNWLYSTYAEFNMDTTPLSPLSKSVSDLKSKVDPTFIVKPQEEIDYEILLKRLREYTNLDVQDAENKDYKADVLSLLPLAIKQLASNITNKYLAGLTSPQELVTESESRIFIAVLSSMEKDLYAELNVSSGSKIIDSKIPAKLFVLKDLSEILKARGTYDAGEFLWSYSSSKDLIDRLSTKVKEMGLMDDLKIGNGRLDPYDTEFPIYFRASRLRSNSTAY
jgi:hypothetical protein